MGATHDYAGIPANTTIKARGKVESYADGVDFLAGQESRILASNVMVRRNREHDNIAVVLYDTEIIRYYPDGTFSVDNGGYNTPTSASRVTQFTPPPYWAHHSSKKMLLNGSATGHDNRFPCNKEIN
jgi:hypothetical protein